LIKRFIQELFGAIETVGIIKELVEIGLNEVIKDVQSGSRITLEWKRVDNKSGRTTLASAHVLYLNLLSYV